MSQPVDQPLIAAAACDVGLCEGMTSRSAPFGNVGRPQGALLRGGIPDLVSPDNHPFKTRNGRLTIPAHRQHDLLEVVIIAYEPSLGHQRRLFREGAQMNCQAFTNDSLTMMYEAIRGAFGG
jgi:hypothetical protein